MLVSVYLIALVKKYFFIVGSLLTRWDQYRIEHTRMLYIKVVEFPIDVMFLV